MTMKSKIFMLVLLIVGLGLNLSAARVVVFLNDGNVVKGNLVDMSSRRGNLEFKNGTKIHKSRVWMVNFADGNWDYPDERNQLPGNKDAIFLRNGGVFHDTLRDFSSRRGVFEFAQNQAFHHSAIKRIYFCCNRLPQAFANQRRNQPRPRGGRGANSTTYLLNGRSIPVALSYVNDRKTGFTDGLQINTHDVWMINFENNGWNFPRERAQLHRQQDTILLWDGEVFYDTLTDYSKSRGTFQFANSGSIHQSKIKRIYFCCEIFPDAYKGNMGPRGRGRRR